MKFNVKDFMTDQKLQECGPAANGVYIHILCVLFNSEERGRYLFKTDEIKQFADILPQQNAQQINQQTEQQIKNICCVFAGRLVKHLPFSEREVESGLVELILNNVLYFEGFYLCQKRMIHDASVSKSRSNAGRKGAMVTNSRKNGANPGVILPQQNAQQKKRLSKQQNPNYNYSNKEVVVNKDKKGVLRNTGGGTGEKKSGGKKGLNDLNEIENKMMNQLYEVNDFLELYFRDRKYASPRESLAASKYMDLETLEEWAKAFNKFLVISGADLDDDGRTVKTNADWVRHFGFWLAKQDLNQNPQKINEEKNKNHNGKQKQHSSAANGTGGNVDILSTFAKIDSVLRNNGKHG